MLKTVTALSKSTKSRRMGNHRVVVEGDVRSFYYFYSCICKVNDKDKVFYANNCGYDTLSTNRAVNDYVRFFDGVGYKRVDSL